MKKSLQSAAAILGSFFAPMAVFAQNQFGNANVGQGQTAGNVLATIKNILDTLIPILITLGVIYLIWGVITYITAKEEEDKKNARSVMISGALGLFFILAIWGIIGLISSTFGIGLGGSVMSSQIPGVN
jgi:hypothetical protein